MCHSPEALRRVRRSWRCDCDGEPDAPRVVCTESHVVDRMRTGIGEIVGDEPPVCPWRALYDPTVIAARNLAPAFDKGNLSAVLDEDSPGIWTDALMVYVNARDTASAYFAQRRHEQRMREIKRK